MKASAALATRLSTAAAIAASGYIHADLYLNGGYRHIHIIGTAFLLQAGGAFAVTLLLLVSDSAIVRLGAAAVALGALGGFTLSRTIGIFGFTEHGFPLPAGCDQRDRRSGRAAAARGPAAGHAQAGGEPHGCRIITHTGHAACRYSWRVPPSILPPDVKGG
ncbi:hypothetical protein ABZU75_22470 [Streptosporangium sp. NPDC005286]|uniref:hypothetical protein n=1 Tax=Streptosporangium sp. NPDC005286 TaxID=3154463 RepID=UPI0033A2A76E